MNNSKKVKKLKKNWKAKKRKWKSAVGVRLGWKMKAKKNESTLFIEIKTSR